MKKYNDVEKNVIALFLEVGFAEEDGYLELLSKDAFTQIQLQKSQHSNAFFINVYHGSLSAGGAKKKILEERMSDHGIPGTSFQLWYADDDNIMLQIQRAIKDVLLPWLTVFQIKDNLVALDRWEYLESDISITRHFQPFNLTNFPQHYHRFISLMKARGFVFKVENIGFSFFKQQGDIWDVISINLESCATSLSIMALCWIPEFELYEFGSKVVKSPREVKVISGICFNYIESEKLTSSPHKPIFIGDTSLKQVEAVTEKLLHLVDNIAPLMFSSIIDTDSLIRNISTSHISSSSYESLVSDLRKIKLQR